MERPYAEAHHYPQRQARFSDVNELFLTLLPRTIG
jgi:hypothetical protein